MPNTPERLNIPPVPLPGASVDEVIAYIEELDRNLQDVLRLLQTDLAAISAGGIVAPHADTHSAVGSDPVSPWSIGAATASHTHVRADVTDFAHPHVKADITDFPATMPPDAHTHTTADITNFPTAMPPTAHRTTHTLGGSDAIAPADIGAAPASHTHTGSDITSSVADADKLDGYHANTRTTANTIPVRDISGKVPGSITGDADTVDGSHAGTGPNNVLKLDASGLVPLANIPATLTGKNADQLDGYHANTGTTANTIPVRDSSGKIPGSITGDADTVDGYHAADLMLANVWTLVTSGSASVKAGTFVSIQLLGGGQHNHYLVSVYADVARVVHGLASTGLCAYVVQNKEEAYDTLVLGNQSTVDATFYYSVLAKA